MLKLTLFGMASCISFSFVCLSPVEANVSVEEIDRLSAARKTVCETSRDLLISAGLYSGGAGTELDPYQIANKVDLLYLGTNTADYSKNFIMIADIDLFGESFTNAPIASEWIGVPFSGVFDGNGFVIENLTIDTAEVTIYFIGLFGKLTGVVKNLSLENVSIYSGLESAAVGAFCGANDEGAIIRCFSSGQIEGNRCIGGLCGCNWGGSVIESFSSCTVEGETALGGLCGASTGSIGDFMPVGPSVGGSFENCYFDGSVISDVRGNVGGLCGFNNGSIFSKCYSVGIVKTGSVINTQGVLFGKSYQGEIDDCYFYVWHGINENYDYDTLPWEYYGRGLTHDELLDQSRFLGFDFSGCFTDGTNDVWSITPGYCPCLSWNGEHGPPAPSGGEPVTTLKGSGEKVDPYVISEHVDFSEFCNNSQLAAGYYVLETDIYLTNTVFVDFLIGRTFFGQFDGCGNSIYDLSIVSGNGPCMGAFRYNLGEIVGLRVLDLTITGGATGYYIGGLCGVNAGTISNCMVSGVITGESKLTYVSYGSSSGGGSYDYGAKGGLSGGNRGFINNCISQVSLIGDNNSVAFGGLIGENEYSSSLKNSFFAGELVVGTNSTKIGGCCGVNTCGVIENCYSSGSFTIGDDSSDIGGVCGYTNQGVVISCFWDKPASHIEKSAGGIGKTTAEMHSMETFTNAGWDFNNIWYVDEYPALRCFNKLGTYSYWLMDASIPISLRAESDDPAGDGIPNLLKYACGLPAIKSCSTSDLLTLSSDSQDTFSVLYYKSKSAKDIALEPIWASALPGPWSALGITKNLLGEDGVREQWKASIPFDNSGFIRLRATLTE